MSDGRRTEVSPLYVSINVYHIIAVVININILIAQPHCVQDARAESNCVRRC